MLSNIIKVIFRNIRLNKTFSLINVAGLAIGMASCVYIFLYVLNELSYDRYHRNADRL